MLKGGEPIYHIDRTIKEMDHKEFDDGSHIICVNWAYTDDETPIGKLIHDLKCTKPDDMYYSALADRVRYFKETKGGKEAVCKAFEEIKDMGAYDKSVEIAKTLIERDKDTLQDIADVTGLSLEEVEALAQLQPA